MRGGPTITIGPPILWRSLELAFASRVALDQDRAAAHQQRQCRRDAVHASSAREKSRASSFRFLDRARTMPVAGLRENACVRLSPPPRWNLRDRRPGLGRGTLSALSIRSCLPSNARRSWVNHQPREGDRSSRRSIRSRMGGNSENRTAVLVIRSTRAMPKNRAGCGDGVEGRDQSSRAGRVSIRDAGDQRASSIREGTSGNSPPRVV